MTKLGVLADPAGITVDNTTFDLSTDSGIYQQYVIAKTRV